MIGSREADRGPKAVPESEWREWLDYIDGLVRLFSSARGIAPREMETDRRSGAAKEKTGVVLLFSPHPDDEALTGALPLRLSREGDALVVNVAVTAGSNPARRERRLKELREACRVLGFSLDTPHGGPFDGIGPGSPVEAPALWLKRRDFLVELLHKWQPRVVFFPHGRDGHPTHEGVARLAGEAVQLYTSRTGRELIGLETEYWRPMDDPNVLVGLSRIDTAHLVAAIARHRGEVERHPFHVLQPMRLMDNVRRGTEMMKGHGGEAEEFLFGECYRASLYRDGLRLSVPARKTILPPEEAATINFPRRIFP